METPQTTKTIISDFMLNSVRRSRTLNEHALDALAGIIQVLRPHRNGSRAGATFDVFPAITGSVAELYIDPMTSCIGDIDVMFYNNDQLAVPEEYEPRDIQLPEEFSDSAYIYRIRGCPRYPGYVYIVAYCDILETQLVGHDQLTAKCWNGPAQKVDAFITGRTFMYFGKRNVSMDFVGCIRCPVWPPQAAGWVERRRFHGWPDEQTIQCVVRIGCDMVAVAHRSCKANEIEEQWRISFSRAEVVLLNSWTFEQQLVYHMLRFFAKTEQVIGRNDKEVLSNYVIKTVMLWLSESESRSYWQRNLVDICVCVFGQLAYCLFQHECEHYFVHNCNIMTQCESNRMVVDLVASTLLWFTDDCSLAAWFADNYLRKCSDRFVVNSESRLPFYRIYCERGLEATVESILKPRALQVKDLESAAFVILTLVSQFGFTMQPRSWQWLQLEIRHICANFDGFLRASAFLHVVLRLSNDPCDQIHYANVLDVFLRKTVNNLTKYELACDDPFGLLKGNIVYGVGELIEVEMQKLRLHAFVNRTDIRCAEYTLSSVYLAILYYITGDYFTTIHHCTRVLRHCRRVVINYKQLPKIDDDLCTVGGLAALYEHILYSVDRDITFVTSGSFFTSNLFVCFLKAKSLMKIENAVPGFFDVYRSALNQYLNQVLCTESRTVEDVVLFNMAHKKYGCFNTSRGGSNAGLKAVNSPTRHQFDTGILKRLLIRSAIEHLTQFRQVDAQNGSKPAMDDFQVMYSFNSGNLCECLRASYTAFESLLLNPITSASRVETDCGREHNFVAAKTTIFTHPELLQLMDDDIASILGLIFLCDSTNGFGPATLRRRRSYNEKISQLAYVTHLIALCQRKLKHSSVSLANTLRWMRIEQLIDERLIGDQSTRFDALLMALAYRRTMLTIRRRLTQVANYCHRPNRTSPTTAGERIRRLTSESQLFGIRGAGRLSFTRGLDCRLEFDGPAFVDRMHAIWFDVELTSTKTIFKFNFNRVHVRSNSVEYSA